MPYKDPDTRRDFQKTWHFERRAAIKRRAVEYLGGKCLRCGYDRCIEALEFHHRDPTTKEHSISGQRACNKPWEVIRAELDKCDLLCANCHREVEYELEQL